MKKILYTIFALGIAALSSSCQKDEVLGAQNQGKPRPTAEVTVTTLDDYHVNFTVTASENASQYAYAIFAEEPVDIDQYDVLTGNITTALQTEVFNSSDAPSRDIALLVNPETTIYIYSCAITSTGLLSEVAYQSVTTLPEVEIQTGSYTVSYAAGEDVANPMTGEPFGFTLSGLQYSDGSVAYVIMANWFNIAPAGYTIDPMLVGTADPVTRTITFDGTFGGFTEDGGFGIYQDNAFGTAFMYYDEANTQLLAFWGGGDSGTDPVVVEYDENGTLTTISYCDYTIHDAMTGAGIQVFDALTDGTLTYVPQESSSSAASLLPVCTESSVSALPALSACTK